MVDHTIKPDETVATAPPRYFSKEARAARGDSPPDVVEAWRKAAGDMVKSHGRNHAKKVRPYPF